jgi:hypothetical protein
MRLTADSASPDLDPASRVLLARTRSAVLNVLVAMGLMIAISGWLFRARGARENDAGPQSMRILHRGLMTALLALGVSSFLARRLLGRQFRLGDPAQRQRRFFRAHVVPALLAALVTPLGLVYGWFVAARLDAVIAFWVVPLALGAWCMPREHEIADLDRILPDAGAAGR